MKLVKKIFLLSLFLGAINHVNAQFDPFISGGFNVSSLVDTAGKVYVWGNNKTLATTGVLGLTGSSAGLAMVPTPTMVTFPANVKIRQISNSSSHFLAVDCNGGLWAWGYNEYGQVGNGTKGNIVTTPTRVGKGMLASESAIYDPASTGFISAGVKNVHAATNNSYAILEDGRLIAWGANSAGPEEYSSSNGMLGNGTTVNSLYPVLVKSGITTIEQKEGEPLKRVTQVYTSDNVAFALVDNPFGTGVGTVYSWGYGRIGQLGRNALSTANPVSNATVQDAFARPVRMIDGSPMENIVAISAGVLYAMALDVDGYIWSWGEGAWNKATGNSASFYSSSDPRRVLAGTTTGASNDGTYLLARSIGAGLSIGMAITVDNKPVAWGGDNTCTGGYTGTSTTSNSGILPSYIKRSGVVDSNVASIASGKSYGYYQLTNGTIYTWGCNENGQLGTGNVTNQPTAVQWSLPAGIVLKDLQPSVKLTPRLFEICASKLSASPVVLNNSFNVAPANANLYRVRWYKNNAEVTGSPFNATTGKQYTANSAGTYKVTMEYIGAKNGCKPYPIAEASTTISTYAQTFTPYSNLTYCNTGAAAALSTTNTENPIFNWYHSPTSTILLATSVGNNSTFIDLSSVPANKFTKTVYVEETSQKSGILFKKNQACDTSWNYFEPIGAFVSQTGITTYDKDVTIKSLSFMLQSQISPAFNGSVTDSATINFGVYGSTMYNGAPIADEIKLLHTFVYKFKKTNTTSTYLNTTEKVTVPVNFKLPLAGVYFISLKKTAITNSNNSGNQLRIGSNGCSQVLPKYGTPNGYVDLTYTSKGFSVPGANQNQSNFFDIAFATAQGFCNRVPVTYTQQCPCSKPSAVSLASSLPTPKGSPETITVCTGTGTLATLNGTFSSAPANGNYYSIYKKGGVPTYTQGNSIIPKALTAANAGTWILRVADGSSMDPACFTEDSVVFVVNPSTHSSCIPTGTEVEDITNTIHISPNPFNDFFLLETANLEKVRVLDQRGILVEEKSVANLKNIPLGQSWPAGFYMLQLSGNGTVKTVKVIKEQ